MSAIDVLNRYRDTMGLETYADIAAHGYPQRASGYQKLTPDDYDDRRFLSPQEMGEVNLVFGLMTAIHKHDLAVLLINEYRKRMTSRQRIREQGISKRRYLDKRQDAISIFGALASERASLKKYF